MDCAFAPDSPAERQWWDASRRSRQTAHRVFAGLFLVAVAAQTILLTAASVRRPTGWFLLGLPLLLAALAGWEWHEARRIERRLGAIAAPPSRRLWLTAALEACAPPAGIALLAAVFDWRAALGGPPLVAATLIPLISVLRLDYRICLGQGAIAAGSYLLLVLLARSSGEPGFPRELLHLDLGKAMLLLLGGAIAGFVAERVRRAIREVIREADERASTQEKLARRTRDYQQAEARIGQKDEFISILSHDLRTPLDGVAGLAQLMARSPGQFSASEIRQYADTIQETARNLREMLDNLVVWAELKTSTAARPPQRIALGEVVQSVARLFAPARSARRLRFRIDVPPAITVIGDSVALSAVVRNLISNAIKFTPPGGRIEVRVHEAPAAADAMLALVVADSGIGMAAANTTRVDRGAEPAPMRRGVGLALVHQLLETVQGRLELRPAPGGGTEAWAWLLRADGADIRAGTMAAVPDAGARAAHDPGREPRGKRC